jgi:outer membrane receptor protein involved in Fe transport
MLSPGWVSGVVTRRIPGLVFALLFAASASNAQERARPPGTVTGRVVDAGTGAPLPGALATVEGTTRSAHADSVGYFRVTGLSPGPHVLLVRFIGFARARVPFTMGTGAVSLPDVALTSQALQLEGIIVTADPASRARGELGTASVVDRDAIANQVATSLAGILELTPGVPLQPPGLDDIQQVSLRAVPVSGGGASGSPSSSDLAAFGTLIVRDGVPLSNNANLQSTGARGEILISSTAGGGIDLRRLPASTIERVEVIRGVPSARFGDLTSGAIVVDTRAGAVAPEVDARYDGRTTEISAVGGADLGARHAATATADVAHTKLAPGIRSDDVLRVSLQAAHRFTAGAAPAGSPLAGRLVLDSRLDAYQLFEDNPEDTLVAPGAASRARETGFRLSERARLALSRSTLEFTFAVDHTRQRSFAQSLMVRQAMPLSDRLTEGRQVGRYVIGPYVSRVNLEGDPWMIYGRLEFDRSSTLAGFDHRLRIGGEWRREWNAGPGYQFDILYPPQSRFNEVEGFYRPRRWDEIPAVATSGYYVDGRFTRSLAQRASLDVQAGARLDLWHWGTHWLRWPRQAVLEPRLNVQLAPRQGIRLRAGWGRTAKLPSIGDLYPAPQYFDVVNVNWYASDPAERLAVLTTFIRDPTNPDLRFAVANKAEAGIEVDVGPAGATVAVVGFSDRTNGGVAINSRPTYILREHYQLSDSTQGTGVPPTIVEPASSVDTVPVLLDRPENVLTSRSRGVEVTALLPEIRAIRTRLDVQAAWIETELSREGLSFGASGFQNFQLLATQPRTPYWEGSTRKGSRTIVTTRLVHHQPALGLVVTATFQFYFGERVQDVAATDTLAWAGYVTRWGQPVPVPRAERGDSQYADLHLARGGFLTDRRGPPDDWLFSFQVSKALPFGGRLSFYAFNAFSRQGKYETTGRAQRLFSAARFGLELTMPVEGVWRGIR